jgi:hypothetical protein
VDDGLVEATAEPLAKLARIPAVTLLERAVRLAADLMRIDHDRRECEAGEFASHEEGGCARLEGDGRPGWQGVLCAEAGETGHGRRERAAGDELPVVPLDDEYTLATMHVETHVVAFHRAVLPSSIGAPRG